MSEFIFGLKSIVLADKVSDYFDHRDLFFDTVFGDHQNVGDEGIDGKMLLSITAKERFLEVESMR